MSDDNVIPFQAAMPSGMFWLCDLPQRRPVSECSISTGWWELDEIYKLYPGQFTVVTGVAGHGKSTFMFNVLCNLSKTAGVRSFWYVPENEGHLHNRLRHIWRHDASFDYFAAEQCVVQSANTDDSPRDLHWVLNRATFAVRNSAVEVVLIDPWNELDRAKPKDMLMTDYIGESLMMLKDFCRATNAAVIVVAHPTKAVNEKGGRIATLADIEGSMNWFNKCDNGLIVHREEQANSCRVISAKVREIGAGKLGSCWFQVDPETGIFTPQHGAVT